MELSTISTFLALGEYQRAYWLVKLNVFFSTLGKVWTKFAAAKVLKKFQNGIFFLCLYVVHVLAKMSSPLRTSSSGSVHNTKYCCTNILKMFPVL